MKTLLVLLILIVVIWTIIIIVFINKSKPKADGFPKAWRSKKTRDY